jgi:hypothetical protein
LVAFANVSSALACQVVELRQKLSDLGHEW